MYFKNWMLENGVPDILANIIAPLLNVISAKIFSYIYDMVSKKLNNYENHQSISQFEDSLVYKVFLFNIFNNFNSFLILAFVRVETDRFGECIVNENSNFTVRDQNGLDRVCFNELITYVRGFFISGFFLNFLEIIIPAVKAYIKNKNFLLKRTYDWGQIDTVIEKEWEKESYQLTVEVDGVLGEYLEVTLMFSFISMFGQVFPVGFTLAFIIMSTELWIDKYKMMNQIRRPIPKGVANIGSWDSVLEIVSFVSIIVNVSILTFTSGTVEVVLRRIFTNIGSFQEFKDIRIFIFTFLILVLIFVRKVTQGLIPDIPRETKQVLQRHKAIKERMNFAGAGNRPLFRAAPTVGKWEEMDLPFVADPTSIYNKEEQEKAKKEKLERKKRKTPNFVQNLTILENAEKMNRVVRKIKMMKTMGVKKPGGDSSDPSVN
jgi:hypothetical protein